MEQITIDIPDELAQQLEPFQEQFSELFTRLIATPRLKQNTIAAAVTTGDTYREILDFLVSRPTLEQIIGFKVSEASQGRLQALLQKNRELALTDAESTELDLYEQLDTLIRFLKIRAHAALSTTPQN
jgi:hypothetical protein